MKVSARVKDEWLQIPCRDGTNTVRWLGEEAWRKYQKLLLGIKIDEDDIINVIQEVRKTRGGALLDPDDVIVEVLDNDDFVNIVLTTDTQVNVGAIPDELKHVLEPVPSNFLPAENYVFVDGSNLTTELLVNLGNGDFKIKLSKEAINNVMKSRSLVETFLEENRNVYGVTTGIGSFHSVYIPPEKLNDLQQNLIRSHAAGVGNPLSPARTRMLLALRINVLAKGYSGISLNTLQGLIDAFNASCLSWVPEQGSVGASGDLAPLAHLALGIMGEGKMWSPKTGWGDAREVLKLNGLKPLVLGPKEGVALVNGTQLITSIGAEAVERAQRIAKQADVVAALTLEVLKGTSRAFDSDVQKIRPHKGQIAVAQRLRALLHSDTYPSEIAESHRFCNRVQDAYTLRCCPQVHGIVHDTIEFVQQIIRTEMNSGTDNPIVFADRGEIISAGNFHGEYPAKVLDFLSIAVHELASMSEKRTERLVNPALSGLPAYLVEDGGINSGFMIAHCTAAALVSENKVICHPSSVDSMSTSAGQEDHVSMGCFAARKALQVLENVEHVIAIELLAACQAIEFLRPLRTTVPLEDVYATVRNVVKPWDKDRFMAPEIESVKKLLVENKIWNAVRHHMMFYHAPEEQETRVFSPTTTSLREERARPRSNTRGALKRKSCD
ncbi:histidine ammonia-lyase-like isoform X2 [Zophobas morio]|uniref:histidine ammonia-lyase-like isoform X2 n=1 Tax=Zophobas morio TaxID=2755281 RepID=UPI003083E437